MTKKRNKPKNLNSLFTIVNISYSTSNEPFLLTIDLGRKMKTINKEKLKEWKAEKKDFVLINVLSRAEFEKRHIPGSINIPLSEIKDRIEEKVSDKGKTIVVYCANYSCEASTTAAKKLEQIGYSSVFDYKGGIEDWGKDSPVQHIRKEE